MESDSDDEALCFNSNLLSNQGEATAKINESEVLDSQDLFAAETQAMSYGAADSGSEDDMLFDLQTQAVPNSKLSSPPQVEKSSAEKDENDEDLFDFETQAAEFNQSGEGDKEERNSNADSTDSELSLEDVFCMPTTGRKRSSVETNCSVDDGGETQVLDKSEEKTPPKKKSRPTLLLHRASPLLHSPVVAHAACNGHASQNQLGHASQNQLGHASQNQLSQQTIVDDSLDEANSPEFIGSPEIDVMQTQAVVTVPESDEEHDMTKVIDSSIDMFSKETQVVPVFHHTSDVADDMADVSQSDELFCMQTQAVCYTSSQVNPENELLEAETQPVINASGESSILNDSLKENINQCIDKLTREEVSPQKEVLSCSQHLGLSSVNSGITPPTPDTAELSVHSVTAPETKHPVLSSRSENEFSQSKKSCESPALKASKVFTPPQKSPGAKFTPTGVMSAAVGELENSVKKARDNSSTADISSNTSAPRLDSKTPDQSLLAETDSESLNNGRRTQSSRLKTDTPSSSRPARHKQRPVRFRENSKKKKEKNPERGKSDSSARNRGSSDHSRQVTEGVESPEETLSSSHRGVQLAEGTNSNVSLVLELSANLSGTSHNALLSAVGVVANEQSAAQPSAACSMTTDEQLASVAGRSSRSKTKSGAGSRLLQPRKSVRGKSHKREPEVPVRNSRLETNGEAVTSGCVQESASQSHTTSTSSSDKTSADKSCGADNSEAVTKTPSVNPRVTRRQNNKTAAAAPSAEVAVQQQSLRTKSAKQQLSSTSSPASASAAEQTAADPEQKSNSTSARKDRNAARSHQNNIKQKSSRSKLTDSRGEVADDIKEPGVDDSNTSGDRNSPLPAHTKKGRRKSGTSSNQVSSRSTTSSAGSGSNTRTRRKKQTDASTASNHAVNASLPSASAESSAVSTPARASQSENQNSQSSRQSTESSVNESVTSQLRLRSAQKASTLVRVMFTGISNTAQLEKAAKDLGYSHVKDISKCTHLIADEAKRTIKFLCALSKGVHIVTSQWLLQSQKASKSLDIEKFLLHDEKSEKLYKYNLKNSLRAAQENGGLFSGLRIHATRQTKPPPSEIKDIVAAAGGRFCTSAPKSSSSDLYIISCEEDAKVYKRLAKTGFQVVTKEFLLTGILRQKLEPNLYKLL